MLFVVLNITFHPERKKTLDLQKSNETTHMSLNSRRNTVIEEIFWSREDIPITDVLVDTAKIRT